MKINIFGNNNGLGLQQDYEVLRNALKKHEVNHVHVFTGSGIKPADVNIFLELIMQEKFTRFAKYNLFYPNPEWFYGNDKNILDKFDVVMCKTRDTERIFSSMGYRTYYTSFTSIDRFENIPKRKIYLHIGGGSQTKNSDIVFDTWLKSDIKENLIFCRNNHYDKFSQDKNNIIKYFKRLSDIELTEIQNTCTFHLCTSQYEGFGHYINEAKSMGAVIITTDAAPMNELITDDFGILIKAKKLKQMSLAELYTFDNESLIDAVERCNSLSNKMIKEMSKNARESYLSNDKYFKNQLKQIL